MDWKTSLNADSDSVLVVSVLMLPVGVRKAAGTSEPGVLLIHLPRARSL